MGIFSRSNTSVQQSSTTNNAYDQRQVFDSSGGGLIGDGSSIDNSFRYFNVSTDGGATTRALDLGQQLAALFGSNVGRALDTVDDSVDRAVSSASDASSRSIGLAEYVSGNSLDAINSGFSFASDATAGARQTTGQAFDLARGFMDGASDFLSSVLDRSAGQQREASQLVSDAYSDAQGRGSKTDTLVMIAIGGAVLVAVMALRK